MRNYKFCNKACGYGSGAIFKDDENYADIVFHDGVDTLPVTGVKVSSDKEFNMMMSVLLELAKERGYHRIEYVGILPASIEGFFLTYGFSNKKIHPPLTDNVFLYLDIQ